MKRMSLVVIALVSMCCVGEAQAIRVPSPVAVAFVTPRVGWVGGEGIIAATVDGGKTWHRQYAGKAPISQVDAIARREAWAVEPRELLRTTDGGLHWTRTGEPPVPLAVVDFTSRLRGWGISEPPATLVNVERQPLPGAGRLVRTVDGGMHWIYAQAPAPAPTIQSVCFATSSHGWIARGGSVWETVNMGRSWRSVLAIPLKAKVIWRATLVCDAHTAWFRVAGGQSVMNQTPQLFYRWLAGRWQPQMEEHYFANAAYPDVARTEAPGEYPGPFGLDRKHHVHFLAIDPVLTQQLHLVGNRSAPATRAGNPVPYLNAYAPLAISFVTPRDGWVVGYRNAVLTVLRTTNGGRTWLPSLP